MEYDTAALLVDAAANSASFTEERGREILSESERVKDDSNDEEEESGEEGNCCQRNKSSEVARFSIFGSWRSNYVCTNVLLTIINGRVIF